MKKAIGVLTFLFLFLGLKAQETKVLYFVCRNFETFQSVAQKFKIADKKLMATNIVSNKKQKVSPGKIIAIPVPVKQKVWDPSNFVSTNKYLTAEDQRPPTDFEIDYAQLSIEAKEGFISKMDMDADSMQIESIRTHVKKIDKSVKYINFQIDSTKKADFGNIAENEDITAVLAKMKKAKERYYSKSSLGAKIDSLSNLKFNLGEEISRLKIRIQEYEYLTENATFFANSKEKHGVGTGYVDEWGGSIAQQTTYITELNVAKTEKKPRKRKRKQSIQPVDQLAVISNNETNVLQNNITSSTVQQTSVLPKDVLVEATKTEPINVKPTENSKVVQVEPSKPTANASIESQITEPNIDKIDQSSKENNTNQIVQVKKDEPIKIFKYKETKTTKKNEQKPTITEVKNIPVVEETIAVVPPEEAKATSQISKEYLQQSRQIDSVNLLKTLRGKEVKNNPEVQILQQEVNQGDYLNSNNIIKSNNDPLERFKADSVSVWKLINIKEVTITDKKKYP